MDKKSKNFPMGQYETKIIYELHNVKNTEENQNKHNGH